jgi:hypothetical protein
MPEFNKNRIEDVKRRLYDRRDTTIDHMHEGVLHPVPHKVSEDWEKPPQPPTPPPSMKKPPTSKLKKFFIGAVIFFFCAIGFGTYMYFNSNISVSNDSIDIKVLGNAFTKGGEALPLQIEITNRNNANLELADLIISYPRGATDDPNNVVYLPRDSIGTIAPGQTITRNTSVTLFGDEQSIRTVTVSLEYHPQGSNAIFDKDVQYPVTISTAPLSLVMNAPTQATAGQDVSFTVTATLNTALPQGQTMLQIAYPNNFTFENATPAPTVGNTAWDLSGLTQAKPLSITVTGKFTGQDGDQQVFHVYAGTTNPSDRSTVTVVYNSLLQTVTITKPFLQATILVNNQDFPTYTASSGDTINGQVSWVNNLTTLITDGQIVLNLSGTAFDKTAVSSDNGFYDSANNRIVWDKNTDPDLANIQPGAQGVLDFTLTPLSLVGNTSIANPEIDMNVSIAGNQPTLGTALSNVNNFSQKIIKIISDLQIAASAVYASGPLPPKAENATQYTVTWTLSNSANVVNQAQATAILPVYVDWVGAASGTGEDVSFNSTTRQVIWNIGTVAPYTGFTSNREATFTVALKPSLSQVGSVPQLIQDVYLSGQDAFTGTVINATHEPLTTSLHNDPTFKSGDERVIN